MPTEHVLVVGFVNIHTHQAEMMLDYFENIAEPWIAEDAAEAPENEPAESVPDESVPDESVPDESVDVDATEAD
jgi:hypothetical protein